jgi:hypothetical protein
VLLQSHDFAPRDRFPGFVDARLSPGEIVVREFSEFNDALVEQAPSRLLDRWKIAHRDTGAKPLFLFARQGDNHEYPPSEIEVATERFIDAGRRRPPGKTGTTGSVQMKLAATTEIL